ncbi:hypothetical protein CDD81_5977 [Ophiocordyceps australis]|uniref:CAP-Gly domain-containing protein n=1 Tax=Ophiocordyceps australis TaxID=1399860 RepID=A0A2C5YBH0_9HYPO|nr:hypothetical protein CDD81_5977 [Ophiocordyceps australis]
MPDFKPGQTVQLSDGRRGTVRFAGQTHFQVGEWVGVELEDKTGKNDGSVQGQRYFDCPMGYGMFVKPMMVTIVAQPPAAASKPSASRRPTRPSSFNPGAPRPQMDAASAKRRSLNAPSPSPGPKTSRPASLAGSRSPVKSPTKLLSGPPSSSASRTGTPSMARVPSAGARSRTSVSGQRTVTSMGPPPAPASRPQRPPSTGTPKSIGVPARTPTGRTTISGLRTLARSDSSRRPSGDSQAGRTSTSTDGTAPGSPLKSNGDILSPQPTSPAFARASALEKLTAAATPASSAAASKRAAPAAATASPRTAASAAAAREIEDLKAKLKILERKRAEDRDKMMLLERVQGERDKFENVIQKLQQKYQPQQQENNELKKQLKEVQTKVESMEVSQANIDSVLELATLDREMAEETAENLKWELDNLKQRLQEVELELDILREENAEYSNGMTPEERASTGWLQMERTNERLREALLRLRDITQAQEEELRDQVSGLEDEVKEFGKLKEEHEATQEKLTSSELAVDHLRQQLDNALGAEDMIEQLTEQNMAISEKVEKLKTTIEELEELKELGDELEANHETNERQLQELLDDRESSMAEKDRQAAQLVEALEDKEYQLSRFRQLVTTMQGDLEDMRASQAVTEGESEKLNDRSRAMMDLNMKLQISASKAQVKTIDLELRRLEAQEAEQHLEIVKLFLPDSYQEDQDSVLCLLRFGRLAFKADLLNGFIRERINGQTHAGHEDDIMAGCDAADQLVWVSCMCDCFASDISHCPMEQFSKYREALLELEPVERALNSWIDGLRKDDLKEKKCADELHRTVSLLSHLAEMHLSSNLGNYAQEVHMKSLVTQSHLETAAVALNTSRTMVERALLSHGQAADEAMAQHLMNKLDQGISQTRSTKMVAAKTARALQDLKTRSLSLSPASREAFEQTEADSQVLAHAARSIGNAIHGLLTQDEGRTEPWAAAEIEKVIHQSVLETLSADESDTLSTYLARLRAVNEQVSDLTVLATDLDQTHEFDVLPAPWRLRSQELKALKTVPVDAEEELRRVKEEHNEARRTIAQRDEHLSTAVLKIETLEARMRDAKANIDRISKLEKQLESSGEQVTSLKDDIEKQDRELKNLELERDKWKKIASDSRAYADGADAAGLRAGQERAVATAREMEMLNREIESLQSAVRYLRQDNRRARGQEQHRYEWLAEPLKRGASLEEQRKQLVVAETTDVLGELVKMASSASLFNYASLSQDKLAWRPAKATPQYHAARQMEDYATWHAWEQSVLAKSAALCKADDAKRRRPARKPAAQLQIRLPTTGDDGGDKPLAAMGRGVEVVGSREWEALQGVRVDAV